MKGLKIISCALLLLASSAVTAATGSVRFVLDSLVVQNHELVPVPYTNANIYLDGKHPYAGSLYDATTNDEGEAVLEIEEGEHTVIFGQFTGSHSVFASDVYTFTVEPGVENVIYQSLVTTRATINATGDAGWGNAFYITGETELLGNWQTAYRLSPESGSEWTYFAHLPRLIEYKIVKGPWIDGVEEISTDQVQWQEGANNVVERVEYMQNYVYPYFQ